MSPILKSPVMSPKDSLDSQRSTHSYPPTPPALVTPSLSISVSPPSPEDVTTRLDSLSSTARNVSPHTANVISEPGPSGLQPSRRASRRVPPSPRSPVPTQITQFLLAPDGSAALLPPSSQQSSWWSRAWSLLASNAPSNSLSFSLTPLPPLQVVSHSSPPNLDSPSSSSLSPSMSRLSLQTQLQPQPQRLPESILIFTDLTPTLTVYQSKGLLSIDEASVKELGIDTSFWVTVALAYIEFLGDREVIPLTYCLKLRLMDTAAELPSRTDRLNSLASVPFSMLELPGYSALPRLKLR
jgi:hypothetical protein